MRTTTGYNDRVTSYARAVVAGQAGDSRRKAPGEAAKV